MKLKYLENFVAIVEKQSISAAARSQLIAQPALSKQLQALESHYGTKLIIRSTQNAVPTDAGKILYEYAKAILTSENLAMFEIKKNIWGQAGTLHLGVSATPDRTTESLLTNFRKENPDISYEIYETSTDKLKRLLEDKTLEVAIMRVYENEHAELKRIVSSKEQMMAIYRRGCGLLPEDAERITPAMLNGVPLSLTSGLKDMLLWTLAAEGIVPKIMCVSNTRNTAYTWCKNGECVTLLAVRSASDYENEDFCCRPLDSPGCDVTRSIVCVRDRQLSPIAKAFVEYSKNFYSQENFPQIV